LCSGNGLVINRGGVFSPFLKFYKELKMANMSYCMFQNTLTDLNQCVNRIESDCSEGKATKLSPEEFRAYTELVEQARFLVEMSEDYIIKEGNDDDEEGEEE
jgi:hypothetical protein